MHSAQSPSDAWRMTTLPGLSESWPSASTALKVATAVHRVPSVLGWGADGSGACSPIASKADTREATEDVDDMRRGGTRGGSSADVVEAVRCGSFSSEVAGVRSVVGSGRGWPGSEWRREIVDACDAVDEPRRGGSFGAVDAFDAVDASLGRRGGSFGGAD